MNNTARQGREYGIFSFHFFTFSLFTISAKNARYVQRTTHLLLEGSRRRQQPRDTKTLRRPTQHHHNTTFGTPPYPAFSVFFIIFIVFSLFFHPTTPPPAPLYCSELLR
jgi:hypothetical protein